MGRPKGSKNKPKSINGIRPAAPVMAPVAKAADNVVKFTPVPAEDSPFLKAVKARREAIRAMMALAKDNAPERLPAPLEPSEIRDTTRIEGKTVGSWAKLLDKRELDNKKGKVLDLTDLPGWAVWAVRKWKERGSPTKDAIATREAQDKLDKADKLERFALLDKNKADNIRKFDPVKAKKLVAQSDKKTEQATELRNEAFAILKKLEE